MVIRKSGITYPSIRRDESCVDILHGRQVQDPYRWLENPDSEETKAFVDAQNKITDEYLKQFDVKEKFQKKLTELWNYEKYGCPKHYGDSYYYFHNSGLQPQSILYKIPFSSTAATSEQKPEVFLDPNTLSADGTVALGSFSFSENGKYFGYTLSKSGSDWSTIHVKKCDDKTDLADKIDFVKFSGVNWTNDENGFFYHRYPEIDAADLGTETGANLNSMLCYHVLGTKQSDDEIIHSDPQNPTYMFSAEHSDCGEYVIMSTSKDCDPINLLWISKTPADGKMTKNGMNWIKIVDEWKGGFNYITNHGSIFYFKTNYEAPKYRIVKYDLANPSAGFVDVIPESKEVLEFAVPVDQDKLVVCHLRDVTNTISLYSISGTLLHALPLPLPGTIDNISYRRQSATFFYRLTSFLSPGTIYKFDIRSLESKKVEEKASYHGDIFRETKIEGFNGEEFQSKQVFYESKDGTKIPMFLLYPKNLQLTSTAPTFLYGYGGFNISIQPYFSPTFITFVKHFNGVIAIANIRGGGEYGEEWHRNGMLHKKQNVFDDFQHAAKYLVQEGYTSHNRLVVIFVFMPSYWVGISKIAINGGSNGGLLVGACINQAPELFGAAVAEVGVLDMLRFHKFTIGHAWISDYGDPDSQKDFDYIIKYSPYHTVQSGKVYPSTLLMTSDHDDRVSPLHSYKYIAELQHKNPNNPNPLLIRIETKAGHGAGKPTQKRIESASEKFAFIAGTLAFEWVE
ncbi:prolyl endopeptidase-like protein [Paraphysoderma sedebokerense]|nr:prolyl endopeptidase-like protein [Paraphysoderma sedebokerense]